MKRTSLQLTSIAMVALLVLSLFAGVPIALADHQEGHEDDDPTNTPEDPATSTPEPDTPTPEPDTPTPDPTTPTPDPATPTPDPDTPTPDPDTPTPEPTTPTPDPDTPTPDPDTPTPDPDTPTPVPDTPTPEPTTPTPEPPTTEPPTTEPPSTPEGPDGPRGAVRMAVYRPMDRYVGIDLATSYELSNIRVEIWEGDRQVATLTTDDFDRQGGEYVRREFIPGDGGRLTVRLVNAQGPNGQQLASPDDSGSVTLGPYEVPEPGFPSAREVNTAPTTDENVYAIRQGGQCYLTQPVHGEQNVVEFYDYRAPDNPAGWGTSNTYSSYMPMRFTQEHTSRLFLYENDGRVSLVMIHHSRGGESSGDYSAATFRVSGAPTQVRLMDDTYLTRDDRISYDGDTTVYDWMWGGQSRNDGLVYIGLSGDFEMTVDPAWNGDANLGDQDGTIDPTNDWQYLSGGDYGSPQWSSLDMNQPITISPGTCEEPTARLSVNGDSSGSVRVSPGSSATFDASASNPAPSIVEYRWDFDGDGEFEENSTGPRITHTYEETGPRDVTVQVVYDDGETRETTVAVEVREEQPNSGGGGAGYGGGASYSYSSSSSSDSSTDDEPTPEPELSVHQEAIARNGAKVVVKHAGTGDRIRMNVPSDPEKTVATYGYVELTMAKAGDFELSVRESPDLPRTVAKPKLDEHGFVPFTYLEVAHPKLGDDAIERARLTFRVSKQPLRRNGVTKGEVTLYRYADGDWRALETTLVKENDAAVTYEANATGLSVFAIGVRKPSIAVDSISTDRTRIAAGERVKITAEIANRGGADGTFRANLTAFGDVVNWKEVSVPVGESVTVTFTQQINSPGTYEIGVNGETVSVKAMSSDAANTRRPVENESGQPGFGFLAAVLALAGAVLLARRD